MSATPLSALNFGAFSVGGTSLLAVLRAFAFSAENVQADAAGLADRYEAQQAVKQGQEVDFSAVFLALESGLRASNLDVTLVGAGRDGTTWARFGAARSRLSLWIKRRASIGNIHKSPSAVRTRLRISHRISWWSPRRRLSSRF